MAIAEVRVVPVGTRTSSLTKYVARAVDAVRRQQGIRYQLTPTGTVLEGSLDNVLNAVKKMHEATFVDEVTRVVTTVEIDDRRDKEVTMESKVESVQQQLS